MQEAKAVRRGQAEVGAWGEGRRQGRPLALGPLAEVFGTGRGVRWWFGAESWGVR